MRSWSSALLCLAAACGSPEKLPAKPPPNDIVVGASRGKSEIPLPPQPPPAHGRLEVSVDQHVDTSVENPKCHVTYVRASGEPKPLFDVPDCIGDVARMNMIGEADKIGAIDLPAHAANGDEIHIFSIAEARGGNAVPNSEWWAIVVRGDDAWSTALGDRDYTQAIVGADGTVVLEEPPTTTAPGERATFSYGAAKTDPIPMLPSHVVKKAKRTITGQIGPGWRFTGGRPVVDQQIIHEDGACNLDPFVEQGGPVRMTAEVTEWSDGRVIYKCLSIRR